MTYSIVAADPDSGVVGVATATGGLAVGAFVPHARAGAGAVLTQGASTNWLYGERGLHSLEAGRSASETLRALIAADAGREHRQCAMVDVAGRTAVWTGSACAMARGHTAGRGVAVAGNRLASSRVLGAMLAGFQRHRRESMPLALLGALRAGWAVGGDRHGTLSCALKVDSPSLPPVDLRVDYQELGAVATLEMLLERYAADPFATFCRSLPTRVDDQRYQPRD